MRGKSVASFVFAILCIPILSPVVVGEWGTDTWLDSVISSERLDNGDEFGCHGYEGVDTVQELWVIPACKEYLQSQTNSSKWGVAPISFGIRESVIDSETGDMLIESGFRIVGDMVEEAPNGISIAKRNGASLEKGASDIDTIDSADPDTLVSIHWRARVGDLRVREDKDAIAWLEDQPIWFTTWGEWHHHRDSGASITSVANGTTVTVTHSNNIDSESWKVPGSVKIELDTPVISVSDADGDLFPILASDDRKLSEGWRQAKGGIILTKHPERDVILELENSTEDIVTTPILTFNDLNYSVTIVGHYTSNLFRWTQDFSESHLTFTWLVERPTDETVGWKLPLFAIALLIAIPISIVYLVRNDQASRI